MWTVKTKTVFVFYRLFAAWLPESRHSSFARKLRYFFAKKICVSLGENVNIERNAKFTPELKVGNCSGVGISCEMNGPVTIGKNVMMGPEVVVYTTNHKFDRTDIPMKAQGSTEPEPVTVGNDVWIGRRVMIMPGVTIGDGCVIGGVGSY